MSIKSNLLILFYNKKAATESSNYNNCLQFYYKNLILHTTQSLSIIHHAFPYKNTHTPTMLQCYRYYTLLYVQQTSSVSPPVQTEIAPKNMASFINFSRLLRIGARACTQTFGTELLTKPSLLAPVTNLCDPQIRNYRKDPYRKLKGVPRTVPWFYKEPERQKEVQDSTIEEEKLIEDVSKAINTQIAEDKTGRLFAIIHLAGKQFKITESDILVIQGYWPPNPGDQIKLEKVLLVGGTDFTLVGRPMLNRELVSIDATVIDKTMSHTVTEFRFRKRKQYRKIKFYRHQQTMIRVNSIKINGQVDKKLEVEGLDRIY